MKGIFETDIKTVFQRPLRAILRYDTRLATQSTTWLREIENTR